MNNMKNSLEKLYIYNSIESQLDEITDLTDAKQYIKDYMEDGDIHPDIESLLILKEVAYVSVFETGETVEIHGNKTPICKVTVKPICQWISVEDHLPERHTEVLIFRNGKEIESVIYGFHNGRGYTDFLETDFCKVSHWMPLPQPPIIN